MRLQGLDILRGYAIFLMVVFHFSFDLNNFHIIELDLKHDDFWRYFRFLIVSMFVFLAGISLFLAHQKAINWFKVKKRVLILAGASLLVSIGSYTQFPHSWIYFGILHFFLFASLFGLLFLQLPKISFLFGIAIIIAYNFHLASMHWLYLLLREPLHLPLHYTQDLANIIPWFGVFLLGVSFAKYGFHYKFFDNIFFNNMNKINTIFAYFGKHSLIIYLLHQPILFALFIATLKFI